MQSVPINTNVASSNLAQTICDRHDVTDISLKVALNTINQKNKNTKGGCFGRDVIGYAVGCSSASRQL